ncbi:DNA-3-methyladenine glycosylase 2 family protein [Oscillibacter hominis]|uniref:DNA-(apurinic or apyrimidinic site) lyase n=1 Tax=Oscillibacter hominis TaxID=2763056 RepID=A0A7G9B5V8_9FIRM|nr:DNA glycosylase [Oscillibacter hominis]QNL44939.1 DNA-3-methyladenine glycosylase 2 family protein [Oscillibacter hominis]
MIERTLTQLNLAQIADSGQCFRLLQRGPGRFRLIAAGRVLDLAQEGRRVSFHCTEEEFQTIWVPYFDLDTDYGAFLRSIPADDVFLTQAARFGEGVRILRQDPWEMLITFLISQQKQIPAIRGCVETLSRRYGTPIGETGEYAFPSPEALASCSLEELRSCALGYRAPYLYAAARSAGDLSQWSSLSDQDLLDHLTGLSGVGPKVANCIMLFGFHRIAAFPRDVWINRVIDRHYGGNFPLERYDGFAGVIQQYLFYYARSGPKGGDAE